MLLLNKSTNKVSSRRQVKIKEVKDNILVLPNNEYRVILETSSINFELKSEDEQDVLIDAFQNFLNSLPCQLQILIRVREVDIDRYIEQISSNKINEKEDVYKEQIQSYCDFIKKVVTGSKILSRRFYIIIPYKHKGKYDFDVIKEHLNLQRDIIMRGFEKLGMKSKQLNSLEVLDLFYTFYNYSTAKTMELKGQTIETLLRQ